jgi:hypothetical protein
MYFPRVTLTLLVLICALSGISFAAEDKIPVYYAGFAFLGDSADIEKNYPYSFQLSQEKEGDQFVIENLYSKRVKSIDLNGAELVINELGDLKQGAGFSLAFAIDDETVSVEEVAGVHKLVIDLSYQLLVFDFQEMKIVACYPLAIQYIDTFDDKPTTEDIREIITSLYLTNNLSLNIPDLTVERLQKIAFKQSYSANIQVDEVIVEEKAFSHLPAKYGNDVDNFKSFVARIFNKNLSLNQGVSVLPYSKGSAIGNKMSARFANGEVYNLLLPEPDFTTQITVRGFKKVCTDEKAAGSCWVYGSYVKLTIIQPLMGKVYLDEKLKQGASKIVPASQKTVNDWPAYQDSLLLLFDTVTKEFSTESKYKQVNKILEKCR